MKTTLNRRLILHALTEDGSSETPPFSASTLAGRLQDALEYGWPGYEALKAVPAKAATKNKQAKK